MSSSIFFYSLMLCCLLWTKTETSFDFLHWMEKDSKMESTPDKAETLFTDTKPRMSSSSSDICHANMSASKSYCDCDSVTMEVDCSHMNIEKLPNELYIPSGIKIVHFQNNLIGEIRYQNIYNGSEVTELDLSNNRIFFISAQSFQALYKLRRLILSHNRLWSFSSAILNGLSELRELDLSYNDIFSIPVKFFQPVPQLKTLSIESNPFSMFDPKQFEYLPNLVSLNMEAATILALPDQLFSFTPNLKRLSLANNLMTEVPTGALNFLKKVQNLDLSNNLFETVPSNAFSGMKSLRVLYLDRMQRLTKIDKYAFSNLTQLSEIHCSYNLHLSELHDEAFVNNVTGELLSIDQLFIRQNGLRGLSFHLLPWNTYLEIQVRDNPWRCDCHMIWMLGVQVKNRFQDDIRCSSPSHLENRPLNSLSAEDLICGLTNVDIMLITLGVTVAILIFLLLVACCVWRRHFSSMSKTYYRVSKRSDCEDVVYEKTTCDSTS